jgi:hypothetical protein
MVTDSKKITGRQTRMKERKGKGQNRMGICHEGSQDQTYGAAVLKKKKKKNAE